MGCSCKHVIPSLLPCPPPTEYALCFNNTLVSRMPACTSMDLIRVQHVTPHRIPQEYAFRSKIDALVAEVKRLRREDPQAKMVIFSCFQGGWWFEGLGAGDCQGCPCMHAWAAVAHGGCCWLEPKGPYPSL